MSKPFSLSFFFSAPLGRLARHLATAPATIVQKCLWPTLCLLAGLSIAPAALATVPGAPTSVTAVAGNGSATVAFVPGSIGSGTLVNYTVTCVSTSNIFAIPTSPPPATGLSSPITISGMINGEIYTCNVQTTSTAGVSPLSADSNPVTPGTSAASNYFLTVSTAGNGYGNVSSSPAGISCYVPEPGVAYLVAPDCLQSYASGTAVTLTATPTANSSFAGWGGACIGTGTCRVTMSAARNVTATFVPAPFAVAATGVVAGLIGSGVATVTTTIAFNAPDVGQQGSVFVVAWIPQGGLGTLGISALANATASVTSSLDDPTKIMATDLHLSVGPLATTDPNAFVLVQLTSSGWQLVVNGQLIPYASGVLGDQLAAQTILNNTATTNLVGSQFCLGYGSSGTEMIDAGRIQLIARIPESGAVTAATGSCLLTRPQTGWWWNPLESGRGFSLEINGNNLAMATFLYDAGGRATWYLSAGPLNADASYSGQLSEFTGGQTLTGSYQAASAKGDVSGIGLSCMTARSCTLSWAGGTVAIERFLDASANPANAPEAGWWWNANESGRGYFLETQGSTLFATAYMYDAAGNALWYLITGALDGTSFQSNLVQFANGQTLTGSYVEPIISNDNVGPVTIQFASPTSATLTLPDGRQIPVERFRF